MHQTLLPTLSISNPKPSILDPKPCDITSLEPQAPSPQPRSSSPKHGRYDNEIGFAIARASVVRDKGPRMKKSDFFAVAKFRRDRDVTTPFTLQLSPKDSPYIVFPMTAEPGMEGGFVLNLYVKSDVFVRGGGRIKTLPQEHDDSDEEVFVTPPPPPGHLKYLRLGHCAVSPPTVKFHMDASESLF
jgi:hypothetical protein